MHRSIILPVLFVPAQYKQGLSSLQKPRHILTVEKKKQKAVLRLSEGQTSQVLSAD